MNPFMKEALRLAKLSFDEGEVPVGAVVVKDGVVVGRGRNRRENGKNALLHAEISAIDEACKTLGGWRLWQCEMYVTLEPCPMCAWAIIQSRIKTVYFGSYDVNYGALGSKIDLRNLLNSPLKVYGGIMESECDKLLKDYFAKLRTNKN